MKEYLVVILLTIAVGAGAFKVAQMTERNSMAERAKTAVEKEMRTQTENELEVRQMGDIARCAALGGKLRKNGECR